MANPFLFTEEDMDDGGAEATINPFLMGDVGGEEELEGENPFGNPFSFGDDAEVDAALSGVATTMADILQVENTEPVTTQALIESPDPAMSFFGTTIDEADENVESELVDAAEDGKQPPPRPSPPSKVTQDLIESVADHLEQTSTQLLDRLPATRSPSPISMRDIVSPSPTPDSALGDLLDYSDSGMEMDPNTMPMDNPFGVPTAIPQMQGAAPKPQPPRPPPPRPVPPRPTPPAIPAVPVQPTPINQQEANEGDLFDMFGPTSGPSRPPPPKTKDDILSLYEKPKEVTQQSDLMSDDIQLEPEKEPPAEEVEVEQSPVFSSTVTNVDETVKSKPPTPQEEESIAVSPAMDQIQAKPNFRRAPTPDIEVTTCPDNPRSDDEEEVELEKPAEPPIESDVTPSPPTESDPQATADITPQMSEPEQMDTGLDFAPPSGVSSANPFASPDDDEETYPPAAVVNNIFANEEPETVNIFAEATVAPTNIFAADPVVTTAPITPEITNIFAAAPDEFDAFSAKFDSANKKEAALLDGFGSITPVSAGGDVWGDDAFGGGSSVNDSGLDDGFGSAEGDDPFLNMQAPPPRSDSVESVDKEFSVVIRPKEGDTTVSGPAPVLAPPPIRTMQSNQFATDARVNPFDKGEDVLEQPQQTTPPPGLQRTDSQETPQTPLFDEDVSQPLEDFPRINYHGTGWEMQLRQPNKKKITGQRFWKKIFVRMILTGDVPAVQLYNQASDKQPFQELPLQPSYSVSEIGSQQYDQFGKIFTMKLQYIFYKERPGVRPGQVTKAERITNKLSQFAQYAIAGDYAGVKEFGSDLKKLGLPVEHAPQSSQLFKIGSMNYEDMKQFSVCIEEALFKLHAHRDRALNYKMEEVQVTAVDEIYVEQDFEGQVLRQIARVRLFFLAFLSGMPTIELGLNDMWRQGKEVVGRHDIIPVVTEEWIRLEGVEFHNTVNPEEYERSRTIKFQPPDAQYIELMRFRVRPPKNRELPLQLKATWCVIGNKVELRADVLVPGFASRKLGQIPCEDVSIRFPIPECWIYLFRVEKHFRYGSVKSAHRRTGKIKGIERILGAVDTLQESLIEVTSGQAKYEHNHRAIVWRCPRLPKEGQGAYTTHQLVCRMALTSYDQIPAELAPYAFVEFTMPATQVSHATVRSVSVQDSDADEPPEKYVRYLARHEYRVGIETTHGDSTNAYTAATRSTVKEAPAPATPQSATSPMPPSDSDSDSN